jgi:hypothetical protein
MSSRAQYEPFILGARKKRGQLGGGDSYRGRENPYTPSRNVYQYTWEYGAGARAGEASKRKKRCYEEERRSSPANDATPNGTNIQPGKRRPSEANVAGLIENATLPDNRRRCRLFSSRSIT